MLTISADGEVVPKLESPDRVEGVDKPLVIQEDVTARQKQCLLTSSSDTKELNDRACYGPRQLRGVGGHTGITRTPLAGLVFLKFECHQMYRGVQAFKEHMRLCYGAHCGSDKDPQAPSN